MNLMALQKSTKQFFIRMTIFLVLATAILWFRLPIVGSMYSLSLRSDLLLPFGLMIYSFVIVFSIFEHKNIANSQSYKNNILQTVLFTLLAALFFVISPKLLRDYAGMDLGAAINLPFIISFSSLLIAIFNLEFISKFLDDFLVLFMVITGYMLATIGIGTYWNFFSRAIMFGLKFTLPLFSSKFSMDYSTYNIKMENFSVNIGAPCTGIYSLVTFLVLFTVYIYFMSKHRTIDKTKTFLAAIIALGVLFIFNVIRISTIIFIGAYYSEKLALDFFHEYMGSVLFIFLFWVYIHIISPKLIVQNKFTVKEIG